MKVKDLMTKTIMACELDTNLAAAALMMWDGDCGALPVVDSQGRVIGILTDRDITMSVATQNILPAEIHVRDVVGKNPIVVCSADDEVNIALKLMGDNQIRRLPVVNEEGRLQGIFSINDAITHARAESSELADTDVMRAMKTICANPVTS
jgi:CBS domain-containing protein